MLRAATVVNVSGKPAGRPIAPGFVGISFEYPAVRSYTGSDPRAINPVLVQLIRNLAPGQAPVLRIGGDSTDTTWWPVAGQPKPPWVEYSLSPGWIATTRALASALGARLILGVNLRADSATLAGAEARELVGGIGRRYVEALELGNEPEVYGHIAWYDTAGGQPVYGRPSYYAQIGLKSYIDDFSTIRRALPDVPLAGPATGGLRQLRAVGSFLSAEPGVGVVTIHRYPINRCFRTPDSPLAPTLANLLTLRSSRGLMRGIAPYVALVHARGVQFRVDETNSVACGGAVGISDTFGSALWAIDALFSMSRAGVDGVNFHTFPGAHYALFEFTEDGGHWTALVHPDYYGLLFFSRAAPEGSRLEPLAIARPAKVRAWATRAADGTTRVTLINDSLTSRRTVVVHLPSTPGDAALARLEAPSVGSSGGVTLGGQSFGGSTGTGTLPGGERTTAIRRARGNDYELTLPAASAALLTVPG